MLLILVVQPHNWHFVCFWNATANNTTKSLYSIRWSPSTLEKFGAHLYTFTSKRKLREKVEWRQVRAFQKLEEIMSLYICFCFWIVWGCQTDGPPNFACCWPHKKDMMVWYKSWYVQNECTTKELAQNDKWKHYHKKKSFFFSYGTICHICKLNLWMSGSKIIHENMVINSW
jgi:hypothetical protein